MMQMKINNNRIGIGMMIEIKRKSGRFLDGLKLIGLLILIMLVLSRLIMM